jgi:hypothetical protein
LAAEAFGGRRPRLHLPLAVVALAAGFGGVAARRAGRVPDLERDALRYLRADYALDNTRLEASGYQLLFPDFAASLRDIGRRFRDEDAVTTNGGASR